TAGAPTPSNVTGGGTGPDPDPDPDPEPEPDVIDVIINEFYARGGSANQPYTHKFAELYNPTSEPVSLDGASIQYRSAGGTGNASGVGALSGVIEPGGFYLVQLGTNGATGAGLPSPDSVNTNVNPSGSNGTIWLASTTAAISPDDAAQVIDKIGYGTSNSPEGTAVAYPGVNSVVGALVRTAFSDTDDNAVDFTVTTEPTPQSSQGGSTDPEPEPEPRAVSIAEIQGTGDTTPIAGERVVTEGVVTAAYPSGGFRGIYLQTSGSGGQPKGPGAASDGIFVFSDWAAANVQIGDCVRVEGTAGEYNGLTQLTDSPFTTVIDDCAPAVPTELATLPATDAEKEVYEGMLVLPVGTYTITNNYQLNQFGQIGLAVGDEPLYTATEVVRPGPEAEAYEAENQRKYITLDDGSSWNLMTNATARDSYALPYLSHETPMRTASQVTFTDPVILDYRFQWNYQPVAHVHGHDHEAIPVASENDRPESAPELDGNLVIGAFNVLNYFDDLGKDEPGCAYYSDRFGNPVATDFCIVRGAWSESAFADQEAKLVAAINKTGADVLALMEIEASNQVPYRSHDRDRTMRTLVAALNEAAGTTRWAYAPSPRVTNPNEDIIRTGFIYNPRTVQLLGGSQSLIDPAFADAREPLAQKFKAVRTGKPFVMIANHFKSKGSGVDDGTGQGDANPSREAQAAALTQWADTQFSGEAVFLAGDFNAYSMETPIQIMENAGYTNLVREYDATATSYQFSGRLGSLDHVLANDQALRLVTGAAIWDINGDESIAFQYSRRNYNLVDYHRPDEFASSEHDPILVGLNTGPRGRG
ncbi:MAG: ExeM/NucH family extracellular endonuclease, partial [Intrasporangiaceae bacterium]|nr:ExeM/NucH family extracellular endonuclease [Intrasporangiaceae bacterium]